MTTTDEQRRRSAQDLLDGAWSHLTGKSRNAGLLILLLALLIGAIAKF